MPEVKTVIATNLVEAPEPLVRYRKKDNRRKRQLDDMHDTVAGKVEAVMASFNAEPSRVQQFDEVLLRRRKARRRNKHSAGNSKHSLFIWACYLLAGIGIAMIVFGWSRVA